MKLFGNREMNHNASPPAWERANGVWSETCYHTQAVSAVNASSMLRFYHHFTNHSDSLLFKSFPSKEITLAGREFTTEQVLTII